MLTGDTGQTLTDVIHTMTNVVTMGVPYGLLLLIFYWNVYQIIATSNNPEKRKQALPRLLWSIIALAIVFSLAGLINLLVNTVLGSSLPSHAPSATPFPTPNPAITTTQTQLTQPGASVPLNTTLPNATYAPASGSGAGQASPSNGLPSNSNQGDPQLY